MASTGGSSAGRPGAPREGVDGNWRCQQCGNINFPQRLACNRCAMGKPGERRQPELMMQERPPATKAASNGAPIEGVDGNWRCIFCSNVNYSHRRACFLCSSARPLNDDQLVMASSMLPSTYRACNNKPSGSERGAPVEGIDGNWRCMSCSNINWAQRDKCNRCGDLKVQQYVDAASGQMYMMDASGQAIAMCSNGMMENGAMMGGAHDHAPTGLAAEMRQRQSALEARVTSLQATLQGQISQVSVAIQQLQTLVGQIQIQQQMLASMGAGTPVGLMAMQSAPTSLGAADSASGGGKRKAQDSLEEGDGKRLAS